MITEEEIRIAREVERAFAQRDVQNHSQLRMLLGSLSMRKIKLFHEVREDSAQFKQSVTPLFSKYETEQAKISVQGGLEEIFKGYKNRADEEFISSLHSVLDARDARIKKQLFLGIAASLIAACIMGAVGMTIAFNRATHAQNPPEMEQQQGQ